MKIDHYALRVADRERAAKYFETLGLTRSQDFVIELPTGIAESIAMVGPDFDVFISDGKGLNYWVRQYGSRLHHIAYETDVEKTVEEWRGNGVKFQTEIITCPCDKPMKQIFTVEKYGMCQELIERNGHPGFCLENVIRLMRGK